VDGTGMSGDPHNRRGFGLYVHVPFCASICSYCHFSRTAVHDESARRAYVEMLLRELSLRREQCPVLQAGSRPLLTAYLGGGTPSLLEAELMKQLLAGTVGTLACAPDLELTVEANPESLDEQRAAAWLDAGVNRVSLGVQSLQSEVLQLLGRNCDPPTALGALELAGKLFRRVSADWIIGPGLEKAPLRAELDRALDLGVTHFSLYILELHPGTALATAAQAGRVPLASDEKTEELYLGAVDHLASRGIQQYEVANFALPGHESRHNRAYWQGVPWLALGPSAHGFWGRWRYANLAETRDWSEAVAAGRLPVADLDRLDPAARRLERLILGLRTRAGVPVDSLPAGALDLARGREEGLWNLEAGRLVLTPQGFLRIDSLEERLARYL
jgi:putative oxygen-independent coproporphyrinogen III oxidase